MLNPEHDMTRKRRTEILIRGPEALGREMAEVIRENYPVVVVDEPNEGLVMIRVREGAQDTIFNMGEVLVTEARVQIQQHIGRGIVRGHEGARALDLAVIDAATGLDLPETTDWDARLEEAEAAIRAERSTHAREILRTRVNFRSMDIED